MSAMLLILGTILEVIGFMALSDRWGLRRNAAALLLLAGTVLWAVGLGLAIFGS